jgi:hypothetical protein
MHDSKDILAGMKSAIALRKQVLQMLIDNGWTKEQAALLEGACERAVRRWINGD